MTKHVTMPDVTGLSELEAVTEVVKFCIVDFAKQVDGTATEPTPEQCNEVTFESDPEHTGFYTISARVNMRTGVAVAKLERHE